MRRLLGQLRAVIRPHFAPVFGERASFDVKSRRALHALRERYVTGAVPLQEYEWRVRQLARDARTSPVGAPARLQRVPFRGRATRRSVLVPLAVLALASPVVWSWMSRSGSERAGDATASGNTDGPPAVITPFARVAPGEGRVIAVDYFDRAEIGLLPQASSDPAHYGRGYIDGGYAVRVVDPDWHFVATARPLGTYDDVNVAVDAVLLGDVAGRYVALACREHDEGQSWGYRLSVEPARGAFSVARWDGATPTVLQPLQPSPAIRRGHGVNRIALDCAGDQITAVINGVAVSTVQDSTFRRGRVWIGTGVYANRRATAEARFHNLVLSGTG